MAIEQIGIDKYIKVGEEPENHFVGDIYCKACKGNNPQRCKCRGLIHVSHDRQSRLCDQCGSMFEII